MIRYYSEHFGEIQSRWDKGHSKHVILTTDPDLIKDGVQEIPGDFLEWFVKNPSCDFIEVEPIQCLVERGKCSCSYQDIDCQCLGYKIIIPKEESNYKVKNTIFNCGDNEHADVLLTMLQSQGVLSESFVNKITKPIMICTTNFKGNEELINELINQLDQEMKWLNLFSDSFRIMVTTELKLMVIRQKQLN